MNLKPETDVFSPKKFGESLRQRRRDCGYSNINKFSDAIRNDTGIYIDKNTLHMIERGEREPDVSKLVAMCVTLYGVKWHKYIVFLLRDAMPKKFQESDFAKQNEEASRLFDRLKELADSSDD